MPVPPISRGHLPCFPYRQARCLRTILHRTNPHYAGHVRTLWWWSRLSGEWPSASADESLEDRFRRHEKIMRSRYSKYLRRRAMWEKDECAHWPWHMSGRLGSRRHCGQNAPGSPNSSKGKPSAEDHDRDRDSFHSDFESFKAAIDRAISKDPYGTLFGRRLANHSWTSYPSWTPFSWLSHGETTRENAGKSSGGPSVTEEGKSAQQEPASTTVETSSVTRNDNEAATPEQAHYRYDPISMRNVPVKNTETNVKPQVESKNPFLENLFSEHGVDIPVKTHKPHKVYGYDASPERSKEAKQESHSPDFHRGFASSRQDEMRGLLARSKGNNIDTSATYTEASPDHKAESGSDEQTTSNHRREVAEPDDNAPLFSGTTYAGRFSHGEKIPNQATQSPVQLTEKRGQDSSIDTTDSTKKEVVKTTSPKLEPALNRVQATGDRQFKSKSSKLETAVDRHVSASSIRSKKAEAAVDKPTPQEAPFETTEEDVDLLRASDVRAATRTSRTTKQETDALKRKARAKLETEYARSQSEAATPDEDKVDFSASTLRAKLNHVWDHVRDYPNGIVAKTMQSMNAFNDNYKKYVSSEKTKELIDKLVFKDESLTNTPSIYKSTQKKPKVQTFTPSQEVLDAEKERSQRTFDLRQASLNADEEAKAQKAQLSRLASDIRAAYEEEYGPIDINHRQQDRAAPGNVESEQSPAKIHPLMTASVKPGVSTNPVIDAHISQFEPKLADLVDGAKEVRSQLREVNDELARIQGSSSPSRDLNTVIDGAKEVRRGLHEAQLAIRAIESGRPQTVWNAPQKPPAQSDESRVVPKEHESASDLGNQAGLQRDESLQGVSTQPQSSSELVTEPNKVPEPFITPSGSPEWNDEQPPPIESLREKTYDSQFIILAYDPATGKVQFSPMNEPAKPTQKAADAVGVLSRLKNAPEFLKHFATLKRAGYSLFNGSENMLIFKKKPREHGSAINKVDELKPAPETATAVTSTATMAQAGAGSAVATAALGDGIPTDVEPNVAPAATTATPSRLFGNAGHTRVRRQEDVFSGTIRPNAASQNSNTDEIGSSSAFPPNTDGANMHHEGVWTRFTRSVKRTALIVAALGGGAYIIGFIAEGIGAEAQKQNGLDNEKAAGPRKRIVMTGQRPGIYSTESSR
ncbi:hypothetical protein ABEF93_005440 [Exophiala dermatitidis]